MKCMLCGEEEKIQMIHKGCRDDSTRNVMRCNSCGLVFLDKQEFQMDDLYENSGMHQEDEYDFIKWLEETREDDSRRAEYIRNSEYVKQRESIDILDFGCGNGGLLRILNEDEQFACHGVELETAACNQINSAGIECLADICMYGEKKFDVITMFHVIEHILRPEELLAKVSHYLKEDGILIIETPNADDALLTRFGCSSFADFTYWSLHVFLYNSSTLEEIVKRSGYEIIENEQLQRYPITNHLYWLSKDKPGGHEKLKDYYDERMNQFYCEMLREKRECDTLFMICKRNN